MMGIGANLAMFMLGSLLGTLMTISMIRTEVPEDVVTPFRMLLAGIEVSARVATEMEEGQCHAQAEEAEVWRQLWAQSIQACKVWN